MDLLLHNLRTIGTHHCDQTVGEEAAEEIERLRDALAERVDARALLAPLIRILRRLEWSGTYSYCTGWPCCPICKGIKPGHGRDADTGAFPDNSGHRDGCALSQALNS